MAVSLRKKNSGNRSKEPKTTNIDLIDEKKEPFVLVLYSDKTKGVVATKDIVKKCRLVGGQCKAPMPVDLGLPSKEKYDAHIVTAGSDVDYLYELKLLKNGQVDPGCMSDEMLAKKREIALMLRSHNEQKQINMRNAENEFSQVNNVFEESTPQTMKVPEDINLSAEKESDDTSIQNGSIVNNSLQQVDIGISCKMSPPRASVCTVGVQMDAQTSLTEDETSTDTQDGLAFNLSDLECSKLAEDKYNLAPGRGIYINKGDYTSLPSVYPKKDLIPAGSTAKVPQSMVRLLLDILLPKTYWSKVLRTNIPQTFLIAIRDFLNRRLPEDYKVSDNQTKTLIYNACKTVNRKRDQEKLNREYKLANNIDIKKRKKSSTMTIVLNGEEIPVMIPH